MKLLYKFGPFSINTQNKLLFKDDKPVQLKPKVFDTLLVLVEGKGNVLTKDALMEKVWADTAVEENNLQQNISILRKILGEAENGTPYIETLPRRGYRFAATVEEIEEDEALVVERHTRSKITIEKQPNAITDEKLVTSSPQENLAGTQSQVYLEAATTSEARTRTQIRNRALMAGSVITLILMAVVAWRFSPRIFNTPTNNRNFLLKQTKNFGIKNDGEQLGMINGRLSPDGEMIAYSAENNNKTENIAVKIINTDYVSWLTRESSNNWCPLWSADGREIAFLSDRGGQLGLWKVHHVGGAATFIHHFTPHTASAAPSKPWLESWSEDGATIYYEWRNNFFALNVDSKEVRQLTNLDPEKSLARSFALSPDKIWIAYTDRKEGQCDIWKISTKGGEPVQVTNDSLIEDKPVWSADGKSLIYTTSQNGIHELRLADLDSNQSMPLLSGMEAGDIADLSRDGSKILYRIRKDESDLWRVNLATGEDRQITSDLGVEFWPDVSPDGETIAFQAVKGSNFQINPRTCLILTRSLSPESQAVQIAASASQVQWSPHGKNLAFLLEDKGVLNLHLVSAIGGAAKPVTEGGVSISGVAPYPYNHTNDYSWSPDSSKLAYISIKDGLPNLWITSLDGSGELKLSTHTDEKLFLANPFWSPDGKRIAYVSDDYQNPQSGKRTFKVWIANLEYPENPEVIFQTESFLKLVGWSADNELVVGLIDKKELSVTDTFAVDLYQITGGAGQKITTLKDTYHNNLHLSADKKSVAFIAIQDKKSNIYTYALKGGEIKQLTRNSDPTIYFSSLAWSPDGKSICYGRQERLNSFTLIEGLK
jgi:Tol biopolymer transport system component/DNA-binding winged helix-turn-helix (wHTH) protein